jgi:hypothetical protein
MGNCEGHPRHEHRPCCGILRRYCLHQSGLDQEAVPDLTSEALSAGRLGVRIYCSGRIDIVSAIAFTPTFVGLTIPQLESRLHR